MERRNTHPSVYRNPSDGEQSAPSVQSTKARGPPLPSHFRLAPSSKSQVLAGTPSSSGVAEAPETLRPSCFAMFVEEGRDSVLRARATAVVQNCSRRDASALILSLRGSHDRGRSTCGMVVSSSPSSNPSCCCSFRCLAYIREAVAMIRGKASRSSSPVSGQPPAWRRKEAGSSISKTRQRPVLLSPKQLRHFSTLAPLILP